eukprot:32576-Alexandrium_andersonii.AAC.1
MCIRDSAWGRTDCGRRALPSQHWPATRGLRVIESSQMPTCCIATMLWGRCCQEQDPQDAPRVEVSDGK